MKNLLTPARAVVAAAALTIGLAACSSSKDEALDKQADATESASDAAADALESQADAVESSGEAQADAIKDQK